MGGLNISPRINLHEAYARHPSGIYQLEGGTERNLVDVRFDGTVAIRPCDVAQNLLLKPDDVQNTNIIEMKS